MVIDDVPHQERGREEDRPHPGQREGTPRQDHPEISIDVEKKLELIFLPPYSPKLNPIEQLWKFMREWITHNKFHPTLDCLLKDLRAFLEGLKVPNEEVKSRCCFY